MSCLLLPAPVQVTLRALGFFLWTDVNSPSQLWRGITVDPYLSPLPQSHEFIVGEKGLFTVVADTGCGGKLLFEKRKLSKSNIESY